MAHRPRVACVHVCVCIFDLQASIVAGAWLQATAPYPPPGLHQWGLARACGARWALLATVCGTSPFAAGLRRSWRTRSTRPLCRGLALLRRRALCWTRASE